MTLDRNKINIIIVTVFLIAFVLNIDRLVININYAYYAILLGLIFIVGNKINIIIFLFLIYYPSKSLVPFAHNELFGIVNIDDILLLCIVVLFYIKNSKKSVSYKTLDSNSKMAICFALLALFIILLGFAKNVSLYGIGTEGFFPVVKRSMKAILLSSVNIIMIMQLRNMTTQKIVDNAIVVGIIIKGLVCIFWKPLQRTGLINISAQIYQGQGETIERISGSGLDPNQFAAFMLMCFGFFLSRIEVVHKNKYKYYAGCLFSLAGIFSSGSRMGLIGLGIICTLFFIKNIKNPKYSFTILLMAALIISTGAISNITAVKRMGTINQHLDTTGGYGRAHRQVVAMRYLYNNPSALIIGSNTSQFDLFGTSRHIHSYYVSILYRYGAVVLILYLILIYKLFRLERFKENTSNSLIYPLVGYFLPLLTVSYGMFIYFPLLIALASKKLTFGSEKKTSHLSPSSELSPLEKKLHG